MGNTTTFNDPDTQAALRGISVEPVYLVNPATNKAYAASDATNLTQIGSATISSANPFITETNIQNWIRNGQGFISTCGFLATATNANVLVCPMSIFNASNSGKSLLVYSIIITANNSTTGGSNTLRLTTSDPTGTTGFTATYTTFNMKAGGAAGVASLCSSPNNISTSITATGTMVGSFGIPGNSNIEVIGSGAAILLPIGSANGIETTISMPSAGNLFSATVKWIEF